MRMLPAELGDVATGTATMAEYSERVGHIARARVLIRPEHITPEAIEHGAVCAGWARRARFYGGG